MRKKLIAGNWKMNGLSASLKEFDLIAAGAGQLSPTILICPPLTLLAKMARRAERTEISVGGQDCHSKLSGAYTGDISAEMLADAGATHVILGHSERRDRHRETSQMVREKAKTALNAGLTVILCVGETLAERKNGMEFDTVSTQVSNSLPGTPSAGSVVIAYEPVWAIGTGRVATPAEIGQMHRHIRSLIGQLHGEKFGTSTQIIYGGSVNANNAEEIFSASDVDGGLVGSASLLASDFLPIAKALDSV